MNDLLRRITELSPDKRKLLLKAIGQWDGKYNVFPLSFAQERLWFLNQLAPESPVYNGTGAFRFEGPLQEVELRKSLQEIIRRHEILRAAFINIDGQPLQVINPISEFELPVVDLTDFHPDKHDQEVKRIAREEAHRIFDLARGPLLRASLLRLGKEDHTLLLIIHHIVSDGWSYEVFLRELGILYVAFSKGGPSPLTELPIQYADFAAWQREYLSGMVLEDQLSYWMQQLSGVIPNLDLPADYQRPMRQSFRGATQYYQLPRDLVEALKDLSRFENVTLYMTLIAAFKVLLYRYTGQVDIVVGTPIANRNLVETEGLIGLFANTLVLRTDLSCNPTFRDLLRQVREVTLGAYNNQDLPFEKLVEEKHPNRYLSHTPLIQVMFVFQNAPINVWNHSKLKLTPLRFTTETAKFDLTINLTYELECLSGSLEYNTDIFKADRIGRMWEHLERLLESLVIDPGQRLSELSLLTRGELEQMLTAWNQTAADYPKERCIHQLFESSVERTPEAVAVVYGEQQLTYRELNYRANQVGNYLKKLGVGPEVLVGIFLHRSIEMVVTLLGVLKAGGAYLPLDPSYPTERLSFMLEDAGVRAVLTQQGLQDHLPAYQGETVLIDGGWDKISDESQKEPGSKVESMNLAYLIYTSGSTGMPKGVAVSHLSICNHMKWVCVQFSISEKDIMLQKTPFTFDASVWEFYAPLLTGGRIVIAGPAGHRDPTYLVNQIKEHKITLLQVVPSLLSALIEEKGMEECRSLRAMFCGGEALSEQLQRRFHERLEAKLVNLYGPTEVTIDATYWEATAGKESQMIGRPVSNTQAYVLGGGMELMPAGGVGELYLGGAQLARGYWNRAYLTAEWFVPDPFGVEPGTRLYRTGDLARWRADGNLEFLGRNDFQVKLRGFRIELGEIEAALRRHEGVQDAVVTVQGEGEEKRLVAYYTGYTGAALGASTLRDHLASVLPEVHGAGGDRRIGSAAADAEREAR